MVAKEKLLSLLALALSFCVMGPAVQAGPFHPGEDPTRGLDDRRFERAFEHAKRLNEHEKLMEVVVLLRELENAERLMDVQYCKTNVDEINRINEEIDGMDTFAESLTKLIPEELSDSEREKLANYKQQRGLLLQAYDDEAIKYENCFREHIPTLETSAFLFRYEVKDYKSLRRVITSINETLAAHKQNGYSPVFAEQLEREHQRLLRDREAGEIAKIVSAQGLVETRGHSHRGDLNSWGDTGVGKRLRVGDEIRTGVASRVRIEFLDKGYNGGSGPTVMNLGENSHFFIEEFVFDFESGNDSRSILGQLYDGTLGVVVELFLQKTSDLKVRTGTTICGIRGTKLEITFDSSADRVTYLLASGDAYIETLQGRKQLVPGRAMVITGGKEESNITPPT